MELSRKTTVRQRSWAQSELCWTKKISLFVMLHAALVHKLTYELFLEPLHATVVQKLPLNLFLKLLHGTVAQALPFEAIS